SSFPAPSQMEVSPGGPRAPGAPTPISSIPTFSWQGLNTGIQPPSPDLAVGPSDVLMAINSSLAQFTRSGTLVKSTTFQTWFSDVLASTCPSNCLLFDPWIVYDQLHGRFILLVSATPSAQQLRTFSYLLLSVSNGATYGSGWKNWALNASLDGSIVTQNWGDSWRLGFDNQAVYLSGNMYSVSGLFQYAKVRVLKKSDVYNPAATSLPYQELGSSTAKLKNADGTLAFSLVPVHQRGKPTSGAVGVLVNSASDVSILPATYLNVWRIVDPLAATLSLNFTTINGIAYNVPAPAPQLGGGATLDSGDTRILKAIYRNGFLYTARDTGYPDQATTITYDVIDTSTTKLASQARLLNANSFYPAFDIPATTPMGTQFASTNLITGTTTAPDGTLMYAGLSNNLKAGEGYYDTVFGGTNRWGDYFGGAVDPVSGGLWVSGEYAKPPITSGFGQSGTWVGYYPWLTTPAFTDVLSSSPFFDYINVLTSWQITTGCGANQFCPTDLVTRDQLAAFIIRSMLGNTFSYTTTPYFTDVPTASPFFPFIQKMADLGLTHGCTPTTYCPSGMVSRQDAAVLIVRGKLESLFGDNFTYPTTPFFTDVPPSLAQFPYVQKMYELGLTSGCSATQFCPNSNLTRQEIAVFLDRAFLN
ncbi:MAG TPA: S-layer homology domain-containing protein, partial [Bryobacteraceae bacterium]|nr:S-layer homology domain-containing protein [Bryobacteraceae bacterium]